MGEYSNSCVRMPEDWLIVGGHVKHSCRASTTCRMGLKLLPRHSSERFSLERLFD